MKEKNSFWIIPEPQHIEMTVRKVSLSSDWRIVVKSGCNREILRSARILQDDFQNIFGLSLPIENKPLFQNEKKCIIIGLAGESDFIRNICRKGEQKAGHKIGDEGYVLETGDKVVIAGRCCQGIFYGTQTLFQLAERGGNFQYGYPISLPCLQIVDWPELKIRGIHFFPQYVNLEEAVKKLARYKINTLVVEYKSKFLTHKHPVLADKDAFTREELSKIMELARDRYIEIVPLLECIGHTDFILSHKEYAHLRENKEHSSMLCPLNPDSLKLIKELTSELISFHEGGKYFHIGADEANLLGTCPQCEKETKRRGKSKLFIDYINKVSAHVKKLGRIPVMWDDMLRHYPEDLNSLDKDIVIHYWTYHHETDAVPEIDGMWSQKWMRKRYDGAEWEANARYLWWNTSFNWDISKISSEKKKLFSTYWKVKGYPQFFKALPYIEFFQDYGLKVVGSPAAICSECGDICANYRERIPNILTFAKRLHQNNSLGMITSCWGSVRELGFYALVCAAEYSWSPRKVSEKEFDRKFCYQYYGLENTEMIDIFYLLSGRITMSNARKYEKQAIWALELLKGVENKLKRNREDLPYLWITARMTLYDALRVLIMHQLEKRYRGYDTIRKIISQETIKWIKELEGKGHNLKKEIADKNLKVNFQFYEGRIQDFLKHIKGRESDL